MSDENVNGNVAEGTVTTKRVRVDGETFITAWEGSSSVKEVSEKTGIKLTSIMARASKYRSEGIALKNMPRGGGAKLNVAAMQALLVKLRNTSTEKQEAAS
jgi:transposase